MDGVCRGYTPIAGFPPSSARVSRAWNLKRSWSEVQGDRREGTPAGCGCSEPLGQRVAKGDGRILGQRQHAGAGDVRIELNRPVALAHDNIGKTDRSAVQRAGSVDHLAVPAGRLRRRRLDTLEH